MLLTRNMRYFLIICYFIGQTGKSHAQLSVAALTPVYGPYTVGFRHTTMYDSSRTYKRLSDWNNKTIPRPIPVSTWYPAQREPAGKQPLTVLNYLQVLKEEEEWENLPDHHILNWFSYSNTPEHESRLHHRSGAYAQLRLLPGKYPAIVYAPSYQASSTENFILCEYLASHGYIVVASPSRGANSRPLEGATINDVEAQARDIEFLVKGLLGHENVDPTKIATMGFSFGGLSNVLAQTRNSHIKAIVSLDGSIKYQYPTLLQSPAFSTAKVTVPFIHFAQKTIPLTVLQEDKLDSSLNTRFDFYDSLRNSEAYRAQFHQLTHAYFSAAGVLFNDRDPRQDAPDREIVQSYKWMAQYTRQFLDAYLQGNDRARQFLQNDPTSNGLPAGVLSITHKPASAKAFSFQDFNELAAAQQYKNLSALYQSVLQQHPGFKPNEGALNNLGLQLLFVPGNPLPGINVLKLATELYPQSSNLFDSLGEAYLHIVDLKLAKAAFKRSLALDPQNGNAKHRLEELR